MAFSTETRPSASAATIAATGMSARSIAATARAVAPPPVRRQGVRQQPPDQHAAQGAVGGGDPEDRVPAREAQHGAAQHAALDMVARTAGGGYLVAHGTSRIALDQRTASCLTTAVPTAAPTDAPTVAHTAVQPAT